MRNGHLPSMVRRNGSVCEGTLSFWDGREIRLWHGTTMPRATSIINNGPSLNLSRRSLDFGKGFYTTTKPGMAISWADRAENRTGDAAALVVWTISYDNFSTWPMLTFVDGGKTAYDFWLFIRSNRRLKRPHRTVPPGYFDIVAGPASLDEIKQKSIPDFDQISFHTTNGLRYLNGTTADVYLV